MQRILGSRCKIQRRLSRLSFTSQWWSNVLFIRMYVLYIKHLVCSNGPRVWTIASFCAQVQTEFGARTACQLAPWCALIGCARAKFLLLRCAEWPSTPHPRHHLSICMSCRNVKIVDFRKSTIYLSIFENRQLWFSNIVDFRKSTILSVDFRKSTSYLSIFENLQLRFVDFRKSTILRFVEFWKYYLYYRRKD